MKVYILIVIRLVTVYDLRILVRLTTTDVYWELIELCMAACIYMYMCIVRGKMSNK